MRNCAMFAFNVSNSFRPVNAEAPARGRYGVTMSRTTARGAVVSFQVELLRSMLDVGLSPRRCQERGIFRRCLRGDGFRRSTSGGLVDDR